MNQPRSLSPARLRHLARAPRHWALALAALLAESAAAATTAAAGASIEAPLGLSAAVQHGLYVLLFAWAAIFIAVLSAMLSSIIRNRNSQRAAQPGSHESMTTEIVWAGVPYVMVVLMAFLAMRVAST